MYNPATNFWSDVAKLLVQEHGFPASKARALVTKYRAAMPSVSVENAIMNFGPEEFAAGIDGRWRNENQGAIKQGSSNPVRIAPVLHPGRYSNVFYGSGTEEISTLIKRLSLTDLGMSLSRQRGSVQMPRELVPFFPKLDTALKIPAAMVQIVFKGKSVSTKVRLAHYSGAKNDYRLTRIPQWVLEEAQNGDLFVLRKGVHPYFDGAVVKRGDAIFDVIAKELGDHAGIVKSVDLTGVF